MKCLIRTILRGDLVKPGEIIDLTDEECSRDIVRANFAAVDSSTPSAPKGAEDTLSPQSTRGNAKTLVAGLTREQAIMKLRQAGVACKGNATNADIATLYNTTFANIAEATRK